MKKPKYKTPTRPLYISVISWLSLIPLALLVAMGNVALDVSDLCDAAYDRLSKWVLALQEVRV